MRTQYISLLVCLMWMCSCSQSHSDIDNIDIDSNSVDLGLLKGTWIYHDSVSFELIEIIDTNEVVYYSFLNREAAVGENDKSLKSYFDKSKANLGFVDSSHIWIRTDKYQFDYTLGKDSLIEYDKMGIQKALIKLKNE
jgi:hypothetical protein